MFFRSLPGDQEVQTQKICTIGRNQGLHHNLISQNKIKHTMLLAEDRNVFTIYRQHARVLREIHSLIFLSFPTISCFIAPFTLTPLALPPKSQSQWVSANVQNPSTQISLSLCAYVTHLEKHIQ